MNTKKQSLIFPFIKNFSKISLVLLLLWPLFQLIDAIHFSPDLKLPSLENPIEIYSNQTQDDLSDVYLQAIGSARESITIAIYALIDETIIKALQQKINEGVPVYIVCDAKASVGIGRKLPEATIIKRVGEGLMHQKILIIDQKYLWLGSANLTYSSLHIHDNLIMGIDNFEIAEPLLKRIKSMDEEGNVSHRLQHLHTITGNQQIETWILPDDSRAVQRIIDLLRTAQKTIRVAMFTWTRMDFAQELIAAKKRGVQVEVVLDKYSGKGASASIFRLLEKEGIAVYLSTGKGLLHHKFAYIDEKILVNGSANWTNAAFKTNDDYFIILYPLTMTQQIKMNQIWDVIQQKSTKL
jgi:cardiolipin synthase